MSDEFPFMIGRVALSPAWTIVLPLAFKQRFEESQMVLWRPGLTNWMSVWGNNTNTSVEDGSPVGYMYREEPDSPTDSEWRFFSGQESQEYVDNPDNTQIYPVAFVVQQDPAVVPFLSSPNGHYGREGDQFHPE